MEKTGRLLPAFIAFMVVFLVGSFALADGAAPTPIAGMPPQVLWGLIAGLIAQGGTFALKKLSGLEFFHKPAGTIVLSLMAAVINGGAAAIKGGWNTTTFAFGIGSALLNFFTTANANNATTVLAMKAKRASGSGSGGVQQAVMFAVLVVAFLGLGAPTCSPGAQALGKCELNALPSALQTVVASIVKIAFNPSSTVADLEGAAVGLVPDQYNCAVAAVTGWLGKQVPPHGQADPALVSALTKLNNYLVKHPATACRDWSRL